MSFQGVCEVFLLQAQVLTDLCDFRGKHDYPSLAISNVPATSRAADTLPAGVLWKDEVGDWFGTQFLDTAFKVGLYFDGSHLSQIQYSSDPAT